MVEVGVEVGVEVNMTGSAVISYDRLYRYRLTRSWDPTKETIAWIMLNPSTADATNDDATIRRCISFSKREGAGQMIVMNLFAYRTAYPKALWKEAKPVGLQNNMWLSMIPDNVRVIAAWGAQSHPKFYPRRNEVRAMFDGRLWCLGKTLGGHPRHPLRLAANTPLELL